MLCRPSSSDDAVCDLQHCAMTAKHVTDEFALQFSELTVPQWRSVFRLTTPVVLWDVVNALNSSD